LDQQYSALQETVWAPMVWAPMVWALMVWALMLVLVQMVSVLLASEVLVLVLVSVLQGQEQGLQLGSYNKWSRLVQLGLDPPTHAPL
jgi:hypothetical protein